jgi:hypothetical protein
MPAVAVVIDVKVAGLGLESGHSTVTGDLDAT